MALSVAVAQQLSQACMHLLLSQGPSALVPAFSILPGEDLLRVMAVPAALLRRRGALCDGLWSDQLVKILLRHAAATSIAVTCKDNAGSVCCLEHHPLSDLLVLARCHSGWSGPGVRVARCCHKCASTWHHHAC